jgi:hypothetical protein
MPYNLKKTEVDIKMSRISEEFNNNNNNNNKKTTMDQEHS